MSALRAQDRVSLCRFTFSDGRKCLTPRAPSHEHFCYFHARKESRSTGAEKLARDFEYLFSGEYLSANDLSTAIGRLFPAVIRGDIKPRTAGILAYMTQTLAQTVRQSCQEYLQAFGAPAYTKAIRRSINQNADFTSPTDPTSATACHPEPACESRGTEACPPPQGPAVSSAAVESAAPIPTTLAAAADATAVCTPASSDPKICHSEPARHGGRSEEPAVSFSSAALSPPPEPPFYSKPVVGELLRNEIWGPR